jgi:hypothetical protein
MFINILTMKLNYQPFDFKNIMMVRLSLIRKYSKIIYGVN